MKTTLARVLLVSSFALGSFAACKGESVAEAAVAAASGGKVSMDVGKDGAITVKGPDGANVAIDVDGKGQMVVKTADGKAMTATYGAGAGTGSDFPLALPAGAQVHANVKTQTPDGISHQVSATVPSGDVKSLADKLEGEAKAKGYSVKRTDANAGGMQTTTLQLSGGAGSGTLSVSNMGGQIILGGTVVKK